MAIMFGLMVGATGCGKTDQSGAAGGDPPGPAKPARVYVGTVTGGPDTARIGLVTRGASVLAYVCSGEEAFNRRDCRWFTGKLAGGKSEVALENGPKLVIAVKGDAAEGTVTTAGGKALAFKAAAVPDDGPAGLYRVASPNGSTLGWIVDDAGWVGGVERKGKDGGSLGAWKSQPGVKITADEQKNLLSLGYQQGTVTAAEIQRVTAP
jgi:hypothetical protein